MLINGLDIPGSYVILFFMVSDFISITSHIHSWVLFFLWLCSSFFLELFSHCSPVTFWEPTYPWCSFSVLSFCLFILFMRFSRQEYWSGLPFRSAMDHTLSELSTMTHPSWVVLQGMAHGFIQLNKMAAHVISLISFLWLWFSFCLPSDE